MFDELSTEALRRSDDAAVMAAITQCARAEAAAAAARLRAIAELTMRRRSDTSREYWYCDDWDAAAAEVSAALGVGSGRASREMDLGLALRRRLPGLAALLAAGDVSLRVVTVIAARTKLVQDPEVMGLLDEELARHAGGWAALSQYKLEQAIDLWVDRFDPGALRQTRSGVRGREVVVGGQNPENGTAALWGRLLATDAAILDRTLTAMATSVCADDPRTLAQRRADALGALGAGSQHLACQCGDPECGGAGADRRAASVVVHVLADNEAAAASPDPAMSGSGESPDDAEPPVQRGSAVLMGGGAVPTPLLAALIRDGARVRMVRKPPSLPEPGYRPSAALAEFVRVRDMTCRFPNCDVPADRCDIDHAIPWPLGPTHPSNLRALCRGDHLLKTFWDGPGGWSDVQHADGTIEWTSPAGQTYITRPGSALLFPGWDVGTGPLPPTARPIQPEPDRGHRGLKMPTRRRTRAAERAYRIRRERALNDARVAERTKPPPF